MVPIPTANNTNSMNRRDSRDHDGFCPVKAVLSLLSERWTLQIVHGLLGGAMRFNEIAREIGVNPRTLCERLRALEECGVVTRCVISEMPPNVEYSLTPKGLALKAMIEDLADWGRQWMNPHSE